MTLADWQNKPDLRARLDSLLRDPILAQAIATIRDNYLPRIPLSVREGSVTEDQLRALSSAQLVSAGFFGFPQALRDLVRYGGDPSSNPFSDLIPWAHCAPEPSPEQPKPPTKKKHARNPAGSS
jgi:hypothetical protein